MRSSFRLELALILFIVLIGCGHLLQVRYGRPLGGLACEGLGVIGFVAVGYWLAQEKKNVERQAARKAPNDDHSEGDEPYLLFEAPARRIKILVQMVIGVLFAWRMVWSVFKGGGFDPLEQAGQALEYATAVELVYSLFTKGLDEAVDPAIMAVGATILLILPTPTHQQLQGQTPEDLRIVGSVLGYALALGALFWVRKQFVVRKEPTPPEGVGKR